MGLQLAEHARALSHPTAQDARHRQRRVVVLLCPPRLCDEFAANI
jgi:hypothetical protein